MKKEDNLTWLLLPSFIGLFVSCLCLVGLTFAWFKTNTTVNSHAIVAANFDIDVHITKEDGTLIEKENGLYYLMPGSYTVDMTRTGTSEYANGYSIIKLGNYTYHSALLEKNDAIEFTIFIDVPHTLEFMPIWGNSDLEDEQSIKTGSSIELKLLPEIIEENEELEEEMEEDPTI